MNFQSIVILEANGFTINDNVDSFTLCADTCRVDSCHECCSILQFVSRVTSISCVVTCVTTETLRNVTNRRGHALKYTIWLPVDITHMCIQNVPVHRLLWFTCTCRWPWHTPNSDHLFVELSTHKTVWIMSTTASRYLRVLLAL